MNTWYIIFNGQQVGPLSKEQLASYGLNRNSMVWTAGMPDWVKAESVPELMSLLSFEEASIPPQYNGASQGNQQFGDAGNQQYGGYGNQQYGGNGNQQYGGNGNQQYGGFGNQQYGGFGNPQYGRNGNPQYDPNYIPSGKRVAAGVLAIILGGFGVQYFICGKIAAGFITILLTCITCGLWDLVTLAQGIYMLTLSDYDFDRKYVYNDTTFPLF